MALLLVTFGILASVVLTASVTRASFSKTLFGSHASDDLKIHAVYAVVYLGCPQNLVAHMFNYSTKSISTWVSEFNSGKMFEERDRARPGSRMYNDDHRKWVLNYVNKDPLAYIREIKVAFRDHFHTPISDTTILRILHDAGLCKKVLEQRALEIREEEIARFTREVNCVHPLPYQLLFLDEMSTDNRSMLRKRGWFLKGAKPIYRNLFNRGKRLSILSFLGVNGFVSNYETGGTFDRLAFFSCVRNLLSSGKVQKWPGRHSVWILDGASIHVDRYMIEYLQHMGIVVIFLPAYCPFYNPIEVVFGRVKEKCREHYRPHLHSGHEGLVLASVLDQFTDYDCVNLFAKCGYSLAGYFDPSVNHQTIAEEIVFISQAEEPSASKTGVAI
eukprot:Lithocolla_globosa_v1_NODE_3889_length_1557_cov_27.918775.p1 type:complete len:387 gc:universal NODE_3889_length_1557_cov_27.918775:336-1496(+)